MPSLPSRPGDDPDFCEWTFKTPTHFRQQQKTHANRHRVCLPERLSLPPYSRVRPADLHPSPASLQVAGHVHAAVDRLTCIFDPTRSRTLGRLSPCQGQNRLSSLSRAARHDRRGESRPGIFRIFDPIRSSVHVEASATSENRYSRNNRPSQSLCLKLADRQGRDQQWN